ncbi:MAG: hypothetical protein R3D98_07665 [Candidatus Krumholzibacteriia bacterium]
MANVCEVGDPHAKDDARKLDGEARTAAGDVDAKASQPAPAVGKSD